MTSTKTAPTTALVFPCPVVIDTREQRPFPFAGLRADARQRRRPLKVSSIRCALPAGDYSLKGFEDQVAVKRKSLNDLFSTLGHRRGRFERELRRLADFDAAAVVCEADWHTIMTDPPPWSHLNPKSVFRSVIAWQLRYPHIAWWFCPGRTFAERATFRILEMYWRQRILPISQKPKVNHERRIS